MDGHRSLRSVPASFVTGPAFWAAGKVRVQQWDRLVASPELVKRAQVQTLLSHCAKAAGTEFGKAHGLGQVRSHQDFAKQVPLRTYADFEPYLERMRQG